MQHTTHNTQHTTERSLISANTIRKRREAHVGRLILDSGTKIHVASTNADKIGVTVLAGRAKLVHQQMHTGCFALTRVANEHVL